MSKLEKSKAVNAPFEFNKNVMVMINYVTIIMTIIIRYKSNRKLINSFFEKEVSEVFSPIEDASKSNSNDITKPKNNQNNNDK